MGADVVGCHCQLRWGETSGGTGLHSHTFGESPCVSFACGKGGWVIWKCGVGVGEGHRGRGHLDGVWGRQVTR